MLLSAFRRISAAITIMMTIAPCSWVHGQSPGCQNVSVPFSAEVTIEECTLSSVTEELARRAHTDLTSNAVAICQARECRGTPEIIEMPPVPENLRCQQSTRSTTLFDYADARWEFLPEGSPLPNNLDMVMNNFQVSRIADPFMLNGPQGTWVDIRRDPPETRTLQQLLNELRNARSPNERDFLRESEFVSGVSQVPGPFGSGGACLIQQEGPSEPETIWARGTELFVRHQLDVLRFETNAGIRVFWAADNDIVDIFFNEDRLRRDLPHGGCAERDQDDALIEAAVVQTAVTQARESNKRIFVSFHLVDRGVESFFDARVDALVDPDPTTPPNIASWETNVTVQCQERWRVKEGCGDGLRTRDLVFEPTSDRFSSVDRIVGVGWVQVQVH